ncbi:P-loop containing nucleoside triphosphate hydrolase protein [Tricladium varicosporioides]|nr:P-loop containing nucleoside triphosphate hydrolase protein [Hymenoscyphus varicosporioides]
MPLAYLQSDEQRKLLDTVAQLRKCGLEAELSLPQMVVCGQQSAGKSSLLEALTEIPFPSNEQMCTRHPTEIQLRRADKPSLSVKIIPDRDRSPDDQAKMIAFSEKITDFSQLPNFMREAEKVIGIGKDSVAGSTSRAIAKDTLSIVSEGPDNPQLTVVDIPGLIEHAEDMADVTRINEITDRYIKKPRTICLAVVAAGSDHDTQAILTRVKAVDPHGQRTLGIITKPDRIDGEISKHAYLRLAQNSSVKLKLGWHVLKNRSPAQKDFTLVERNESEKKWIAESIFQNLPSSHTGIEALRLRLSKELYAHTKKELPQLRIELENALKFSQLELQKLGSSRSDPNECKQFLTQLSTKYSNICKGAVDGHYEATYFHSNFEPPTTNARRLRAAVQSSNLDFNEAMLTKAKRFIPYNQSGVSLDSDMEEPRQTDEDEGEDEGEDEDEEGNGIDEGPQMITDSEIRYWAQNKLRNTRGKELVGNFNPLVISELFWEQSSRWEEFAEIHIEHVASICSAFLRDLLKTECPPDSFDRIWEGIDEELSKRKKSADGELTKILLDLADHPINYNHYYTDNIMKERRRLDEAALTKSIQEAITRQRQSVDIQKAVANYTSNYSVDMETVACEEALKSLTSIYKVKLKVFIDNITVQVIERHIIRGLDKILGPDRIVLLSDEDVMDLVAEPVDIQDARTHLQDKIRKFKEGRTVFRKNAGISSR